MPTVIDKCNDLQIVHMCYLLFVSINCCLKVTPLTDVWIQAKIDLMIELHLSGSQGGVDLARGGLDLGPGVPGGDLALLCKDRRAVEPGGAGGSPSSARPLQGHLQHPLILQPTPHGEWTLFRSLKFINPNNLIFNVSDVRGRHDREILRDGRLAAGMLD